jgi:RNA polymerase sigma factor (sigma-70 family)
MSSARNHYAATSAGPYPDALLGLCSDDQLVALFRRGNEAAFAAIHDRYRRRLLAYVSQTLTASGSDAEDALQDVFVRAYHALRGDERPMALRAWLYRVAYNRCIDEIRRLTAEWHLREAAPPPVRDSLAELQRREQLHLLVDDIRRLPSRQRAALVMREMKGLSYVDLALELDTSVAAVKSLLVRARLGLAQASDARA